MRATRLNEFFHNAPQAYALFRPFSENEDCWVFVAANPVFESLIGADTATLSGKPLCDVFAYDTRENAGITSAMWAQAVHQALGEPGHGSIEFKWPGRPLWMRATVFPAGPGMLGAAFLDITSETMKGQEIEAFFTLNIDMFCVFDRQFHFLRTNHAFGVSMGYAAGEISGKPLADLVHGDDAANTLRQLDAIRTGQPAVSFINRCRHHADGWRDIEWHMQAGDDQIYASARDITAFRELERILKEQTARLQRKVEQLETLSMTDELTGLFNRHYFEARIEEETEQSDRYDTPLSMAILDLDKFKRINDAYGHPVGDEVLQLTARIVRDTVRRSDVVVRLGGEEFLILMPQTLGEAAVMVAEKIRVAVETAEHPKVGHFTASLGVSARTRGESYKRWYRRADEGLYKAKESGRNRVVAMHDNEGNTLASIRMDWLSDWETGHSEIDRQHRELIEVANSLIRITLSTPDRNLLAGQFEQLIVHILQHFRYEERVLELTGYPEAASHEHIHHELANKATHLQDIFKRGEVTGTALFSFMVDDVILGHMTVADRKYVDWIHAHPLA